MVDDKFLQSKWLEWQWCISLSTLRNYIVGYHIFFCFHISSVAEMQEISNAISMKRNLQGDFDVVKISGTQSKSSWDTKYNSLVS